MKIYLPNSSSMSIGGGWTFRRNLFKGGRGVFEITETWQDCDIALITGPTMVSREEMQAIKDAGKKIILRVDNMPRDSRNRGTATSRMRDFALMADYIIFQSKWALEYVGWWLQKKVKCEAMNTIGRYSIIYNGVDTDAFFYKDNPLHRPEKFLYVQQNRDENKRSTEAFYYFAMQARVKPEITLDIVGLYSPELVANSFDFFDKENIKFIPTIENPKLLGDIMRANKYLLFPAYCDASPNTVGEAIACGCRPIITNKVGGTEEVIKQHYLWKKQHGENYSIQNMAYAYNLIFNQLMK